MPADRSDEYLSYLHETGLKEYAETPGHLATTVLRRTTGGVTEFELTTFWESTDAIRAFAGDDISIARYYPADEEFLLEKNEHVDHWEVVSRE